MVVAEVDIDAGRIGADLIRKDAKEILSSCFTVATEKATRHGPHSGENKGCQCNDKWKKTGKEEREFLLAKSKNQSQKRKRDEYTH